MGGCDAATALDGVWDMVRAELSGEPAPALIVQNTTLIFERGRYQVCFRGEPADAGNFELSTAPEGKTLLLQGTAGTNAGRTIPCLYQLVGERLRIRFGLDGRMPAVFAGFVATKNIYVATFRKAADASLPTRLQLPINLM